MKALLTLTFVCLFFLSCSYTEQDQKGEKVAIEIEPESSPSNYTLAQLSLNSQEIFDKTFTMSDLSGYSCNARVDCDCCGGFIVFKADSSFLYQDYCSPETFLSFGKLSLTDSLLILNFSGRMRMKILDEKTDTYQIQDTSFKPATEIFKVYLCDQNKVFINAENTRIIKNTVLTSQEKLNDISKEFNVEIE